MKLVKTSEFAPEQYDIFNDKGEEIGYLRLRGGIFEVYASADVNHKNPIYSAKTKCDVCFTNETERKIQLGKARKAIREYYKNQSI